LKLFAQIILPISITQLTYLVPNNLEQAIKIGMRVEVPIGAKKIYCGIVFSLHNEEPADYKTKSIISILDTDPILNQKQLDYWQWMAHYYLCKIGDVMQAALPLGLKPDNNIHLSYNENYLGDFSELTDDEFTVAEALLSAKTLSYDDVIYILKSKYPNSKSTDLFGNIDVIENKTHSNSSILKITEELIKKNIIQREEKLAERFKPKLVAHISLAEQYWTDKKKLKELFEDLEKKSPRQVDTLLTFMSIIKGENDVIKATLKNNALVSDGAIQALISKNVFVQTNKEISRLKENELDLPTVFKLNIDQQEAIDKIENQFKNKKVVLLQGVTGSGKTLIYIELIKQAIEKGQQVLYLLPEIGLTEQTIKKFENHFDGIVGVYHSKYNNNIRVETWQGVLNEQIKLVVGARSSIFLPFKNLGLIIIDEEHDSSYKQYDSQPHFHARDSAIMMAQQFNAKVLLGSATPSLESYYNGINNKYGFVELDSRYGGMLMPKIYIVDAKDQIKMKLIKGSFSTDLLDAIKETIANKKQVILFQNRRGYSPSLFCGVCGWVPECNNCNVKLTYHKFSDTLHCHYCGFVRKLIKICPTCQSIAMRIQGFGTEKIEDELKLMLPQLRVARLDADAITTKNTHNKLLAQFENQEIDILIGTQMVTKGLDFEHVGLVGVMSADALLNFPDFRVSERAFQLLQQVSGRSGRKHQQGLVFIQALNTKSTALKYIKEGDQEGFYTQELLYRKQFKFPPFYRFILVTLKHAKLALVASAALTLSNSLKPFLDDKIIGPTEPGISRIKGLFLKQIMIKMELNNEIIEKTKALLVEQTSTLLQIKGYGRVIIDIDVDPQ
jgi:primosomal protein N' (replication factor Y)